MAPALLPCRELEELQKLEGEVDALERGQTQLEQLLEGMMGGTAQKVDQGSIQQTSSQLAEVLCQDPPCLAVGCVMCHCQLGVLGQLRRQHDPEILECC